MAQIHSTAVVDSGAELADDVEVGPYSIIGANVKILSRSKVGPHVVVEGYTTIGEDNTIYQFASLGSRPQDLKYHGEPSQLIIGAGNMIREYVTLQPGTEGGGMVTRIGNQNLFMMGSHVGHDGQIGDHNVVANFASLGGHVEVGNHATIGGLSGVHQFTRLGDLCICGGGSMVSQDIPPFCMAHGNHAALVGLNRVGLERAGFSSEEVLKLKRLYRKLFVAKGTMSDKIALNKEDALSFQLGARFMSFVEGKSNRGIASTRRGSDE